MDSPKRITGKMVVDALLASGFIHKDEFVQRIVIDIAWDGIVEVYVQRVGDDRLIDLIPKLVAGIDTGVPAQG